MKTYVLAIFILCAIIAASGCSMSGTGSGKVINQTKSAGGVNQVSLDGMGTLIIQQGNNESLTVEAEDNIAPHIQSNINGNKLEIKYDSNTPTPTKDVKFYLTVKDVNSVTISGAGKVETSGLKTNSLTLSINGAGNGNMAGLDLNKLTINISGAGKLIMAGKATEQTITISGAGEYSARDLQSTTTTLTINGAGKGTVNVSNILNAIINGGGEINYIGNPQINQQINGAGSVTKIT